MAQPIQTPGATFQGIPKSPGALLRLIGTSRLAGLVCAMFGGGIALFLGLSPVIGGSVSGTVVALIVGLLILRYGLSGRGGSEHGRTSWASRS